MKAYNTVVLTLILAALLAIAVFLFKLIKTDAPIINPTDMQSQRDEAIDSKDEIIQIPTPTPAPDNTPQIIGPPISKEVGNIEGKLCYPSEYIPAMDIYIQNVNLKSYDHVQTAENQGTYKMEGLQAGTYVAYAYPVNGEDYGGGYTNAVPCGLLASCTDHKLIEVEVKVNQTTDGVDICDWYGAEIPPKGN